MRRAAAFLAAFCVVGLATANSAGASARALHDRPDDFSGPQVHLIYAVPLDGVDRSYDVNGAIAASFAAAQQWLAGQTGGRRLRVDTSHGQPDITFVRLPETDAQIASHGIFSRDEIEALLRALGFRAPLKIYEVFYDGSSAVCGSAPWPPALPGRVPVVFLKGAPPGYQACDANPFAGAGQSAGYLEMDEIHEILHTLGMAPDCAPHSTKNGHVNDSPTDLMYQGPLPWDYAHMVLDFGHDDYFEAHVPGCIDFSNSAFLQGGTAMPPAWGKPPPLPPLCVVPRITHMTLAQARHALNNAFCRLGHIRDVGRRAKRRLRRVIGQSARPDSVRRGGFSVNVTTSTRRSG